MRKEEILNDELTVCFNGMKKELLRLFKKQRTKIDGYWIEGYLNWNYEDGQAPIKTNMDLQKRKFKRLAFAINVAKRWRARKQYTYVSSTSGKDANSGESSRTPVKTLARAIELHKPGNDLVVIVDTIKKT